MIKHELKMPLIEIVKGGIGLVAGAAVAWRKIVRPYMRRLKVKRQEYYDKLNEIHQELRFNGGSSLKDVIFEVKNKVINIEHRLDSIDENQKLVMNLQGICYWVSDHVGSFVYVSPALCKLMGRSESEILGNSWMAWIHPADKDNVVHAWNFSVENQSPFDEIFTIKKPGSEWIKVWSVAFPKAAKNSTFGGVLGKMALMEESVKT